MIQALPVRTSLLVSLVMIVVPYDFAWADSEIYGVWRPVEYYIGEKVMPLRGLMVITPDYFIGNTTFDYDGDGQLDANANSGPITIENGTIKLVQWMQLHWRSNGEDHFLKEGVPEDIKFTIEGDRLIFHFPSGNKYISERVSAF